MLMINSISRKKRSNSRMFLLVNNCISRIEKDLMKVTKERKETLLFFKNKDRNVL